MIFLQSATWPWWINVIVGGISLTAGVAAGVGLALPWKAAHQAAKEALASKDSDLQSVRGQRDEARQAIADLNVALALRDKDIDIYKAKTNFTEFRKTVESMFENQRLFIVKSETMILNEFTKHAEQDEKSAEQTLKALTALAAREEVKTSH